MPQSTTSFLDGDPVRLRVWNTDTIFRLPEPPWDSAVIGGADAAQIQLIDPTVAPEHAVISRLPDGWVLRESAGELRADGVRRRVIRLEPGLEIGIGRITLVAEGRQYAAVRSFVARLLGWNSPAIDRAMRALRLAGERLSPLALCGPGNMIALALGLHRRAFGAAPFVACDPRRADVDESVRAAINYGTGAAAMRAASGGSICLWSRRMPADFGQVLAGLRDPCGTVHVIVCAEAGRAHKTYHIDPVVVPKLADRAADVARIIDEYEEDEATDMRSAVRLTAADRDWVLRVSSATIPDIEKAVRRLLALRNNPMTFAAAARTLGMAAISLARWCRRLGAPVIVGNGAA